MTRIGMNPARRRYATYRPARVTVAILVDLPHMQGNVRHGWEVARLSLASLLETTAEPHDLLVFDNGCSREVRAYLQDLFSAGVIRNLVTSQKSIGKLDALRIIAGTAPGELIAYADDDIFFYPGWLREHLRVYDEFRKVGMVSGSPGRSLFSDGIRSNVRLAETDPAVRLIAGKRVPEQWEREWAMALGKDPDDYLAKCTDVEDLILERGGVQAYATAFHNQFLAPKEVLQSHLEGVKAGRWLRGVDELGNSIGESGYLRLTTMERTTRLIGSVVSETILAEALGLGMGVEGDTWLRQAAPRPPLVRRLLRWRPMRRFLHDLYNRLFWALTEQTGGWYLPSPSDIESDSI